MKHIRLFSQMMVCGFVLFFGLGSALALPWIADSQRAAARNEPGTPSFPSAQTCYATPDNGATVFSNTNSAPVQQAVDAVTPGGTVKVAGTCEGVQTSAGMTQTVYITKSLTLQGGHTETDWSQDPNPDTHTTKLDASGIGRVVVVTGTVDITLDNLTITGGKAYSESLEGCGGGIWTNTALTLTNSTVFSNTALSGGGMCNLLANPEIHSVTFSENSAVEVGGAIFNLGAGGASSPVLTNVSFLGNIAGEHGGAMSNSGFEGESSPELTNVIFSGNAAGKNGGGMYNSGSGITISSPLGIPSNNLIWLDQTIPNNDIQSSTSSPKLTNVTFCGNSAGDYGGAMFNSGDGGSSHPELNNTILWNNRDSSGTGTVSATILLTGSASTTLTHSLVEGAGDSGINWIGGDYIDGGGNIDEDPLFVEPISPTDAPTRTGNLRLQPNSPAIDAGDNELTTVTSDLDNEPRKKDGDANGAAIVDMGAYEAMGSYQLSVSKTGTGGGQVTSSPAGIDCGNTCSNFFLEDCLITLAAVPDSNSTFTGWGGVCSGTENCLVKITSAMSVTANFETNPQLTVYLSGSGNGTVTSDPKGIACGTDCSQVYPYNSTVQLFAEPDNFSIFKGWSGDCIASADCTVNMDGHKSVSAVFETRRNQFIQYLPISLGGKSTTGNTLSGRVTDSGFPVQVWVDLYFWDGYKWSGLDSIVSDANGEYKFKNLPKLSGDETYRIVFENAYDYDGWLSYWECWDVTAASDPSKYRCDFDIENIFLYSPDHEALVPLPQDFLWVPRDTTSDSYVLNIADIYDYDPWTWTDLLGYVYGVSMLRLPSGFYPYITYGWWVDVVGPDGWGSSFYYRDVTFLNAYAPTIPDAGRLPKISGVDWSNYFYKNLKTIPHRPRNAERSENRGER